MATVDVTADMAPTADLVSDLTAAYTVASDMASSASTYSFVSVIQRSVPLTYRPNANVPRVVPDSPASPSFALLPTRRRRAL